jgi:FRG domain
MSELICPTPHPNPTWAKPIESIGDLIAMIEAWHSHTSVASDSITLSRIWYRGNREAFPNPLRPKVYRGTFEMRASALFAATTGIPSRMHLERHMLKEFRTAGAVHFNAKDEVETYFTAQHFGMPTRLLDWTTNPLIALFFAVKDQEHWTKEGELFVMDALRCLPDPHPAGGVPTGIPTMRQDYVKWVIGQTFWRQAPNKPCHIVPVRPDNRPGRIGQQSSCFTLHVEGALDRTNPTLFRFSVKHERKEKLLNDLRRLNVNQYTIFDDLDHLSCGICDIFGLPR